MTPLIIEFGDMSQVPEPPGACGDINRRRLRLVYFDCPFRPQMGQCSKTCLRAGGFKSWRNTRRDVVPFSRVD
jgi:hypothetical protein